MGRTQGAEGETFPAHSTRRQSHHHRQKRSTTSDLLLSVLQGSDQTGEDAANQTVADNRKAHHDYFIDESYEAGLVLTGSEIKSIRGRRINLRGGYARVLNGEIWLYDVHISPYEQSGTHYNHEPTRPRKLLLHRREISRILGQVERQGFTLVPLRVYFKGRNASRPRVGAQGKKEYDKRVMSSGAIGADRPQCPQPR
jgi:SsrA-binding protein